MILQWPPQSIQWLLERRFPESFGKRNALEVNSRSENVSLNVNANIDKSETDKIRAAILAKLSKPAYSPERAYIPQSIEE